MVFGSSPRTEYGTTSAIPTRGRAGIGSDRGSYERKRLYV